VSQRFALRSAGRHDPSDADSGRVADMTALVTWRSDDGRGVEGTRLLIGDGGVRALGRMVHGGGADAPPFTASYRLVAGTDGTLRRLAVTSATAGRERHLTLNRTDDGFWLLDTGSGGSRSDFDRAVDVDLAFSPMFNTLPIRRLGLHRGPGEHLLKVVFVALPELTAEVVDQRYRAVSPLGEGERPGEAVVGFTWNTFAAELVVDADAVVTSYPGVASRLPDPAPATST
jgi:hypothetical protein